MYSFSTETVTTISKVITNKIYFLKNYQTFNYLFKITKNHQKYLPFGFQSLRVYSKGYLQIYEENDNEAKYFIKENDYFENYFELKSDCSYYINLSLISYFEITIIKNIFFYFAQSNYNNKIIPAEINTENFQEFPIITQMNILLDLTTIEKGNKMLIEYDRFYSLDNSFLVYGYYSNEHNIIQTTLGKELDLIRDKGCLKIKRRCQDYLYKKSSNLKYAFFLSLTQVLIILLILDMESRKNIIQQLFSFLVE